jgi:hypothetical protein
MHVHTQKFILRDFLLCFIYIHGLMNIFFVNYSVMNSLT